MKARFGMLLVACASLVSFLAPARPAAAANTFCWVHTVVNTQVSPGNAVAAGWVLPNGGAVVSQFSQVINSTRGSFTAAPDMEWNSDDNTAISSAYNLTSSTQSAYGSLTLIYAC